MSSKIPHSSDSPYTIVLPRDSGIYHRDDGIYSPDLAAARLGLVHHPKLLAAISLWEILLIQMIYVYQCLVFLDQWERQRWC